jgi:hypothetical protein
MKSDMLKRAEKVKIQDVKYREMPDIVVKVVCRYRAELFFKISRKTKLSRLFNAWTERMEAGAGKKVDGKGIPNARDGGAKESNGTVKTDAALTSGGPASNISSSMQFVFTHNGRPVDSDQTPEEAGMEDGDEILAVEMMDLTEGGGFEEWDALSEPKRQKLKKNWTDNPREWVHFPFPIFDDCFILAYRAKRTMEELFDGV